MDIKKILLALISFFIFLGIDISFAQNPPPAGQIQRSQEILEQEKALREKLEEEEKVFIKNITVKGVTLLSEDQIKEIIQPFQKQWVTKRDIQQLLDFIKQAYKEKGYSKELTNVSYQVKNKYLKIQVEEQKI